MPTIFNESGLRFFFWSNEGDPLEPPHVHVATGDRRSAKFWLEPIGMAENFGMKPHELRAARLIVDGNAAEFLRRWNAYFNA